MFERLLYVALLVGLATTVAQDAAAQSPSLVLSPTSLGVTETGSADYTVKLATQPSGDVTVTIGGTSGTDLTLNKTSLTFTTSNWDMAQTVTVSATRDSDATHDIATLTHTASGGDYGMVSASLPVTVTDTTRVQLSAVFDDRLGEGESTPIQAMLSMRLDDDVIVTVTAAPVSGNADEYELSTGTLTITAGTTESSGEVTFTSLDDHVRGATVRTFNVIVTPDHSRVDADTRTLRVNEDDYAETVPPSVSGTDFRERRRRHPAGRES